MDSAALRARRSVRLGIIIGCLLTTTGLAEGRDVDSSEQNEDGGNGFSLSRQEPALGARLRKTLLEGEA